MTDKIIAADVLVCSPTRNFVTLKITTADGVVGYGDATLNGRELSVASYLRDHVAPLLIGRDASRIEDTWQYLYRGVYWRRGPVTMAAIGAVDVASGTSRARPSASPSTSCSAVPSATGCSPTPTRPGGTRPRCSTRSTPRGRRASRRFECSPGYPAWIRCTAYTRRRRIRARESRRPAGRGSVGHRRVPQPCTPDPRSRA